jgi:hypothetical protein
MSEKSEENSVMNRTLSWQDEIAVIAGPRQTGDTRESWLARAARKSGATFWHIKALYYGQITDPKYSIASKIISAADKARVEETRRDAEKATELYRIHAARLQAIDPDFHREQIDVLLGAARIVSERDSA